MEIKDIRQLADIDCTETLLSISYAERILNIYTNRATVMNRILKCGYTPTKIFKMEGEIEGMEFEVSTKEIGKFMRTGLFKFD